MNEHATKDDLDKYQRVVLREIRQQRVYTAWFNLYEIQEQMKPISGNTNQNTVMCHLKTRVHPEKCIIRWLCSNIIKCTFTYLGGIAYYTTRVYGIACCS